MKTTQQLHDLGQSLWLDNITRTILTDGTLRRYITDLSVTGLTSNPTIFDEAIKKSSAYDDAIESKTAAGASGEGLFFDLALEDRVSPFARHNLVLSLSFNLDNQRLGQTKFFIPAERFVREDRDCNGFDIFRIQRVPLITPNRLAAHRAVTTTTGHADEDKAR